MLRHDKLLNGMMHICILYKDYNMVKDKSNYVVCPKMQILTYNVKPRYTNTSILAHRHTVRMEREKVLDVALGPNSTWAVI